MTPPFRYPSSPHVRRHGPQGYADYESYRDWLRDEFAFRCVYCLSREVWLPGGFHLDHFIPASREPDQTKSYENLVYSCSICNLCKYDLLIPDPTIHLVADSLEVLEDGRLFSLSPEVQEIIQYVRLNRPSACRFRLLWMRVASIARENDPDLLKQILGFPESLPDLSKLRPPGGNVRPEGIEQSYFRQRERGELPETY